MTFTGTATLVAGDDDSQRSASAKVSIVDDDHEVSLSVTPGSITGDKTEEVIVTATLVRPANRAIMIIGGGSGCGSW